MTESLKLEPNHFVSQVLDWFDQHGRHDLPWQKNPEPYRVWVSEIMLQQTQVSTVIPYFQRFMDRFPGVEDLAAADTDQVLHLWTGLGYYARARNLHKAAQIVSRDYQGRFPGSVDELQALPGIGRSTAGAIAALAMNIQAPILDGNVKRVLTRYFAINGWPEKTAVKNQLWEIAEQLAPARRVAHYTQAMMDLGATVCLRSKPLCQQCPLAADCQAFKQQLTAEIPGKKPRKTLPVKSTRMHIIRNKQGEVLLQKRPPQGIWGSLYSLPEGEMASKQPADALPAGIELGQGKIRPLPALRHTFSHYHLDIEPMEHEAIARNHALADSDRWLWYPLDHSIEVGLAAPVKKLLGKLAGPNQ